MVQEVQRDMAAVGVHDMTETDRVCLTILLWFGWPGNVCVWVHKRDTQDN